MALLNIVGQPGSGKSLISAEHLLNTLDRNEKFFKKSGQTRLVYSNIRLSDELEKRYSHFLRYWNDRNMLHTFRDADIFIDEIAGYFNSRDWEKLSEETRLWLMLHEHYGIELYCNTQNWKTIDLAFRRLTTQLVHVNKWIGCRRPSPTKPPVKFIWGIVNTKNVSYKCFDEEEWNFQYDDILGDFFFITQARVGVYNTRQDLDFGHTQLAKHIEKTCATCGWKGAISHR